MATLRDIGSGGGPMPLSGGGGLGGGGGGGGHPNSDDDEDEENEGKDEAESWFAGGERRYVTDYQMTDAILMIILVVSRFRTQTGLESPEETWSEIFFVELQSE